MQVLMQIVLTNLNDINLMIFSPEMASERSPIQRSADSLPVQQEYLPSGFADSEVHPQSTFLKKLPPYYYSENE